MPTITSIKPQKKEGRFNIYLDGKFAFGIDGETLVREKLEVGQELSPERINMLTHCNKVNKLADKALRFLSFRPRSEKEVRDYLWKRVRRVQKVQREQRDLIEEVVGEVKELGYVDDATFVSWWLEQRIRFRPRGKMLLRSELFAKGIDRDLIEEKLSKYSTEDELSWAKRVAEKKIPQYKNPDPKERREKLSPYLARRGFSWEVIEKVFDSAGFSL